MLISLSELLPERLTSLTQLPSSSSAFPLQISSFSALLSLHSHQAHWLDWTPPLCTGVSTRSPDHTVPASEPGAHGHLSSPCLLSLHTWPTFLTFSSMVPAVSLTTHPKGSLPVLPLGASLVSPSKCDLAHHAKTFVFSFSTRVLLSKC